MNGRHFCKFFLCFSATLALLLASSHARAAGEARRGGGQEHPMLQKMRDALDSLGLSADQKKQIDEIFDETREDIRGMAKDLKGLTPEQRREKLKPVIQSMIEKIKSVLTDEQKTKLREKLEEIRKERVASGGASGGAKPRAARRGTGGANAEITEAPPSTQPDTHERDIATGQPQRGPMLQRIHDRLAKLDLSPQQQTKIDSILDQAGKQFQALREDGQNDAGTTRDKAKDLMQSTRQQIAAVLTPEQQQKWKESADPNRSPPAANLPTMQSPKTAAPDTTATKAAAASLSAPALASSTQPQAKALYEGAAAPPFRLTRLNGSAVTLDSFSGKPLVLIFGSFSSPTFRDKAAQVDQLAKKYRGRAAFLIVYTREAYPVNEWEVQRNIGEQIKIDQHKSLDDRTKMAKLTQNGLKISTDMAVDDIDDAVTDAYDAMPNGAYVIANGKIVDRQKWADPLGLPAWIDVAMKKAR